MPKERVYRIVFLTLLTIVAQSVVAFAHGDRVIPQVAEGTLAGLTYRTKFDIINLSPRQRISKVKVLFFRQDGSPWSVLTNQGTVSEITLNLGLDQTIRIETSGSTAALTAGYAIIRNMETTFSTYSDDFEVGISVFYEILSGPDVVDTVSVPTGQPTLEWIFPVETNDAKKLYTGFAIVNLANESNKVTLTLLEATTPSSKDGTLGPPVEFTLNANEQKARFLNESGLFPSKTTFKGMLVGYSEKPVSILALLQTSTPSGVQYATLVPSYLDAMRRNTYTFLPQPLLGRSGMPLDVDSLVVDYFQENRLDQALPWDLIYETQTRTTRRLVPKNAATLAVIGSRTAVQFDDITLDELKGYSYSSSNIDMSDASANLKENFAFAVKTSLGRYAKLHVASVIKATDASTGDTYSNLALEIYVYR